VIIEKQAKIIVAEQSSQFGNFHEEIADLAHARNVLRLKACQSLSHLGEICVCQTIEVGPQQSKNGPDRASRQDKHSKDGRQSQFGAEAQTEDSLFHRPQPADSMPRFGETNPGQTSAIRAELSKNLEDYPKRHDSNVKNRAKGLAGTNTAREIQRGRWPPAIESSIYVGNASIRRTNAIRA
jgi:hypothetical protein